ncbi:phosphate ABC transporter substrate-binding protein [Cognatilysobacter bugurensis]|uniref:Phosphate ABC transporter substrate-binding protein n=1 Tax=Cognatilysobacter bugurensis TaxID=543356 RepID=A0A918W8A6_9GAMM|nr:phosphate ABC transporter substrate-binding protein [Lysobacter bugurensis]GHA75548.1 hypothetical protein GCM10007067_10860 [Lysobacter bugurensis]
MKSFRLMLGALALVAAAQANAGAVVAASGGKAAAMDAEAAKRVFLGRDPSAQVIYQKSGATREAFDKGVLGKPGAELTTYWSKLIFTGKAKAPVEVGSDAEVKAKLAANPSAVGYVSDSAVDGSVKVLYKF